MKLNVERWPTEKNRPSLTLKRKWTFLHGLAGVGSLWRPVASMLESEAEVLAPDLRGHGLSRVQEPAQKPTELTPTELAEDVDETLTAHAFAPSFVVGHSLGARVACALARLHPASVRGIVMIDIPLSTPLHETAFGTSLSDFLKQVPPSFESRTAAKAFMTPISPAPEITQYLMASLRSKDSSGRVEFPFDADTVHAIVKGAAQQNLVLELRQLIAHSIPVLILRGGLSTAWTDLDYARDRAHFANDRSIQFEVFERSGHGLPFQERGRFVELLRTWSLAVEGSVGG